MHILGVSAFYHDSAACLVHDGEIICAAQEERFTRKKHDLSFPINAINYCLKEAKIEIEKIDYIVFYDKPFLKFERILETYLAFAPLGFQNFIKSMPVWIKEKLFQRLTITKILEKNYGRSKNFAKKLLFNEHHLSHAASAFFPSPFEKSAVLTLDGVGEWCTSSVSIGNKNTLKIIKEIHFPHSLGLLYSSMTHYLGFKVNSGEYKVMGLAPYGTPKYTDLIKNHLIDIKNDGSFHLNISYFDFCTGNTMIKKKFERLFGGHRRLTHDALTQKHMDLAASIQKVTEEIIIKLAKSISSQTGEENLCLAGGVALNCVATGILKKTNIFKNIWVQPASGDAGGSIGAALSAYHLMLKKERLIKKDSDNMKGCFLGPEFSNDQVIQKLENLEAEYETLETDQLINVTVENIIKGNVIGWMDGRMEFGPRALGARSIIADPRNPQMQKTLNLKIKFRESFRPFAPSVLSEHTSEWFNLDDNNPYMTFVASLHEKKHIETKSEENKLFGIDKLGVKRSSIPAVTHVDYSARVQTVHKETNLKFHKLISKFHSVTGCPILINTSFNVRGEPIVCSVEDAFKCFMGTGLDVLVIGDNILFKNKQKKKLLISYKNKYEAD